jgi:hypothetical protein
MASVVQFWYLFTCFVFFGVELAIFLFLIVVAGRSPFHSGCSNYFYASLQRLVFDVPQNYCPAEHPDEAVYIDRIVVVRE